MDLLTSDKEARGGQSITTLQKGLEMNVEGGRFWQNSRLNTSCFWRHTTTMLWRMLRRLQKEENSSLAYGLC
ncbi:hypothetical protein V2J09_004428 [Rumex salicifolius]